ncbi:MAG TPA: dephospho-CoA kinase [Clostridiaceae bacterium]|nr:dephospho-CoA kinase [Clostridiaceae bacterium]
MIRIGLTGGIASGKSTVARFIRENGIAVIDADGIAREVLTLYPAILDYLKERYGNRIFREGELDRKALGNIIFSNEEERRAYMEVIIPFIRKEIGIRMQALEDDGESVVVLDAPLLFEEGLHEEMDYTILVFCEPEVQMARLMSRDTLTRDEALSRIRSQMDMDRKLRCADFVVDNSYDLDGTFDELGMIFSKIGIGNEE